MSNKMRKIGQSINEYVLVITLVTLAGVGMQAYIRRGIQGIVKISADTLAGETGDKVTYSGTEKSVLARSQWNPVAVEYEKNRISGGFFVAKKTGNQVYYVYYPDKNDLKNEIIIGGEIRTDSNQPGKFTSFDPVTGYPDAIYAANPALDARGNPIPETPLTELVKDGNGTIRKNIDGYDYSKYEIITGSTASKSVVQNGVIESGLIKFEQKNGPIKVEVEKKIIVKTDSISSGPRSLAEKDFHPAITEYYKKRMVEDRIGGFIQAEIKGSKVYYYLVTTDINNKTLIGGEDLRTHDFTQFDMNGFPVSTVSDTVDHGDNKGYEGHKYFVVLRTYGYVIDPKTKELVEIKDGYVIDPETKEIVGVKDGNGNIYRKGQIVTIRSVPASSTTAPETIDKAIRTKTIEKDTTHVTGAWEATYKLESANTFGAKDMNRKDDAPKLP